MANASPSELRALVASLDAASDEDLFGWLRIEQIHAAREKVMKRLTAARATLARAKKPRVEQLLAGDVDGTAEAEAAAAVEQATADFEVLKRVSVPPSATSSTYA